MLGQGSTFWFELELQKGNEPAVHRPSARRGASAAGGNLRVLIADDNPLNQTVAQVMLGRMGHAADVVSNGEQALARLTGNSYSVVLMDCQMPLLDGYETARRIRSGTIAGIDANLPIIALTAYALSEDRQKCLDAGMDDYLAKPVRSAELHAALQRCGLVAGAMAQAAVNEGEKVPLEVLDLPLLEMMRSLPGRSGPSLLPEMVAIFVSEESSRLAELTTLAEHRDAAKFARLVHTFAGSCASVGGQQMRMAALDLERAATSGAWAELPALFSALHAARTRFHQALNQYGLLPR